MKRIVVSILAVFYLSASVGATVHLHYCMEKLINWSLLKSDGDQCDKCGMKKDGGCCKDESKFVKNNIDQKVAESSIQLVQMSVIATASAIIYTSGHYFSSLIKEYPINHAPPGNNCAEIYILNRVFRI